jgi:transcriptional regulator GlxA family with amidase domain
LFNSLPLASAVLRKLDCSIRAMVLCVFIVHRPNASPTLTLVAKHYREPLTIADIAQSVHMAPAHAMRVFRKFSGMTLYESLIHHRVSHAQRLLTTTDGTIDHICAESGFGSPARFYACFHKVVGQSASAYRRSFAENS